MLGKLLYDTETRKEGRKEGGKEGRREERKEGRISETGAVARRESFGQGFECLQNNPNRPEIILKLPQIAQLGPTVPCRM